MAAVDVPPLKNNKCKILSSPHLRYEGKIGFNGDNKFYFHTRGVITIWEYSDNKLKLTRRIECVKNGVIVSC